MNEIGSLLTDVEALSTQDNDDPRIDKEENQEKVYQIVSAMLSFIKTYESEADLKRRWRSRPRLRFRLSSLQFACSELQNKCLLAICSG